MGNDVRWNRLELAPEAESAESCEEEPGRTWQTLAATLAKVARVLTCHVRVGYEAGACFIVCVAGE